MIDCKIKHNSLKFFKLHRLLHRTLSLSKLDLKQKCPLTMFVKLYGTFTVLNYSSALIKVHS